MDSVNKILLIGFGITIFFLPLSGNSQISIGEVVYNVNADAFAARVKKNNEAKNINRKSTFEKIADEMHRIQLILSFKDSKSVFRRAPGLAVDNSERIFELAIAFADRGTFFTELKEKELLIYREYKGEVILIESNLKEVAWELTTDQKKIGEFECYKAISSVETSIGKLPIIAWYTPEIPLAFGPADYGGTLPGLILELHTNEVSYICKEINLNIKKGVDIEWPDTKKAITPEAYKKLNEDLAKSFRRN